MYVRSGGMGVVLNYGDEIGTQPGTQNSNYCRGARVHTSAGTTGSWTVDCAALSVMSFRASRVFSNTYAEMSTRFLGQAAWKCTPFMLCAQDIKGSFSHQGQQCPDRPDQQRTRRRAGRRVWSGLGLVGVWDTHEIWGLGVEVLGFRFRENGTRI